MSQDPNVIFTLKAVSVMAQSAFLSPSNARFYVPQTPLEQLSIPSRESTPATHVGHGGSFASGQDTESANIAGNDDVVSRHQLRFTFDRKPKNIQRGFVFGSNPRTCDVIIGNAKNGISASHFRITFDDQNQLVLIDSSTLGTAVSYGNQARNEIRMNPREHARNQQRDESNDFKWILFPGIQRKRIIIFGRPGRSPPVVELSLDVTIPGGDSYKELKNAYLNEMRTAIPFGLDIDSIETTAAQTEESSPKRRLKQCPIWIDLHEIGSGEFGTVFRAVDVSTGELYAAKKLMRRNFRERWDKEVAILRTVSHHHIVAFEHHNADGEWPRLIMEYLPLGNLAEQHAESSLTKWETVTTLCQGLNALEYLHARKIVHRDLKPENILIHSRGPRTFRIKIADFGLAKNDSILKTSCGTRLYAAPEIWQNRPYTAKVDIWSLGIIAFQYTAKLPRIPRTAEQFDHERWYNRLAQVLENLDSDELLDFLSGSMLQADPKQRLSASECRERSATLQELFAPENESDPCMGTPTEEMSSSAVIEALGADANPEGQQVVARKLDTQTAASALEVLSAGIEDSDTDMIAEGVETPRSLPMPGVPELERGPKDDCQTIAPSEIHIPGPGLSKPNERSQQQIDRDEERGSQRRHSKRQCMDRIGGEAVFFAQRRSWIRYGNQTWQYHQPSNCMQIVVDGKAISIRKSDLWLNATQLLNLAGKPKTVRERIFRLLHKQTKVEVVAKPHPPQSWIPYSHGRFLCEFLELSQLLKPLLEYGEEQGAQYDDRANYFLEPEYLQVKAGDIAVFVRRKDFWINATNILNARSCTSREISKFQNQEGLAHDVVRRHEARGIYVNWPIGLQLCKEYELSDLGGILRKMVEDYGFWRKSSSQFAVIAPKPTTVDRRQYVRIYNNRGNNKRPSCQLCIEKHRKCDRNDTCEHCRKAGLECVYKSLVSSRRPRTRSLAAPIIRAAPIITAAPRRIAPKPLMVYEGEDLGIIEGLAAPPDDYAEPTVQKALGNATSLLESEDGSSDEGSDEHLDEDIDEHSDEDIDEHSDENIDEHSDEDIDEHASEAIGEPHCEDTTSSPGRNLTEQIHRSIYTELSFANGSILPPFKPSFLRQVETRDTPEPDSDLAAFDDEELWVDAVIKG